MLLLLLLYLIEVEHEGHHNELNVIVSRLVAVIDNQNLLEVSSRIFLNPAPLTLNTYRVCPMTRSRL